MPKRKRINMSRGFQKYIRREKARIKREVFDVEEQKKLIDELYVGIKSK